MVTGGINIMTNVSSATNVGDSSFSTKNNVKSSNKMDFQSMFTNTADNSKTSSTEQANLSKTDNTTRYDADKSGAKIDKIKNDSKSISDVDDEIDAMYEEVRTVIKDKLGISDEELDSILDELSMTMSDLLNPRNIMQLMLENSGAEDPVQFITDADVSEIMKDINATISDVVAETADKLQVSPKEVKEFASALDDMRLDDFDEAIVIDQSENVLPKADATAQNVDTGANDKQEADGQEKASKPTQSKNDISQGMESVITRLDDTVKEVFATSEVVDVAGVDTQDVINQINQAIKVNMSADSTSMELTLNPENLGKVNIQVVSKNGVITANIATQDEAVRRAVETQLITLRETLNEQGIKVEAVEVTVASFTYDGRENEENNGQGSQRRGRHRVSLEDDNTFDDGMVDDQEEMTDSTINYRA